MGNTRTEKELTGQAVLSEQCSLILYNDEVHTFEQVIKALIKVCGHSNEQAEQCTFLVHFKGKCDVKRGAIRELKPMLSALCDKGLTAAIEE